MNIFPKLERLFFRCAFLCYFFLSKFFCFASCNTELNDACPLFVSLGSHCEVAIQLREQSLRSAAFPFDWLLTLNHERFLALFEEDFELFLEANCFFQHPTNSYMVENDYYQIEWRHDWPFTDYGWDVIRYQQHLLEIQSKYQRRVARFKQLADFQGKVYFLRAAFDFNNDPSVYWGESSQARISVEQAVSLKEVLEKYFPSLEFELVIINYVEENAPAIVGIKKIREFKIRKSHKLVDYRDMFNSL